MAKYTLIYFKHPGGAEVSRILLAATGTEYEDVRIELEEWPAMKPTTPQGHLPLLEVNGKTIPQRGAIQRFLARELDMYGSNNLEMTAVDVIIGTIEDMFEPIKRYSQEQDETKKAKEKKKLEGEVVPSFLKVMDKILTDNGGDFFVGNKLTLGDIAFFSFVDRLCFVLFPECLKDFPKLEAHRQRVMNMPKIKAYLDTRPKV